MTKDIIIKNSRTTCIYIVRIYIGYRLLALQKIICIIIQERIEAVLVNAGYVNKKPITKCA